MGQLVDGHAQRGLPVIVDLNSVRVRASERLANARPNPNPNPNPEPLAQEDLPGVAHLQAGHVRVGALTRVHERGDAADGLARFAHGGAHGASG